MWARGGVDYQPLLSLSSLSHTKEKYSHGPRSHARHDPADDCCSAGRDGDGAPERDDGEVHVDAVL